MSDKVRLYCWKREHDTPFIIDLPFMKSIGHPVFINNIFDLIDCDGIMIVSHEELEVDLE